MVEAEKLLRAGAAIMEPKLNALGFTFQVENASPVSASGSFANGCFRSDNRALCFSFRHSLGLVKYQKGLIEMTHEQLMRALGLYSVARYPGFSSDPMAAFADLLSDLQYCDAFLLDSGTAFSILAGEYSDPPIGFKKLGRT